MSAASAVLSPTTAVPPTTKAAAEPTRAPTVVVGASVSPTQAPATGSRYADGTYSATGTSRFGNVTDSVTTTAGKISNVQITQVTTKFPVSHIALLPAQVTQNQTANVNVVTGATYSSQAFKQAVQQALAQALAANSSAAASQEPLS